MNKLLHIAYGVLKSGVPFDPNYGKQFSFTPWHPRRYLRKEYAGLNHVARPIKKN